MYMYLCVAYALIICKRWKISNLHFRDFRFPISGLKILYYKKKKKKKRELLSVVSRRFLFFGVRPVSFSTQTNTPFFRWMKKTSFCRKCWFWRVKKKPLGDLYALWEIEISNSKIINMLFNFFRMKVQQRFS